MVLNCKSSETKIMPNAALLEPNTNDEASKYIVEHYELLIKSALKAGVKEDKAHDLVADLYISIREAEDKFQGFNPEYGDGTMDVSHFVHGRLQKYAKNSKYRSDVMEVHSDKITVTRTVEVAEVDAFGNQIYDRNGKIKTKKIKMVDKKTLTIKSVCASYDEGSESDENDSFQKAYMMAQTASTTDDTDEKLSLREQIEFCIDICEPNGVNILGIFRNIDKLAALLGDSKRKGSESLFSKLTGLVSYHNELGEAITSILHFSAKHRDEFDEILATF